jgi:hypothetical protein
MSTSKKYKAKRKQDKQRKEAALLARYIFKHLRRGILRYGQNIALILLFFQLPIFDLPAPFHSVVTIAQTIAC